MARFGMVGLVRFGLVGLVRYGAVRVPTERAGPAKHPAPSLTPEAEMSESGKKVGRANPKITAAVNRCFLFAEQLGRGQLFHYDDMFKQAGFDRESKHWSSFSERLKNRILSELGIHCHYRPNSGLMLLNSDDHTSFVPRHHTAKAKSQFRKVHKSMRSIKEDDLTPRQRELREMQITETVKQLQAAKESEGRLAALRAGSKKYTPRYERGRKN